MAYERNATSPRFFSFAPARIQTSRQYLRRKDCCTPGLRLLPQLRRCLNSVNSTNSKKNHIPGHYRYARAFSLLDSSAKNEHRRELRQGTRQWLASRSRLRRRPRRYFLLTTFDEISSSSAPKPKRNAGAKEPFDFVLRKAPACAPIRSPRKKEDFGCEFLGYLCGPCRALEPLYEKAAAEFRDDPNVLFLAADCDDDESLVAPYLEEIKPRTTTVSPTASTTYSALKHSPLSSSSIAREK